MRKYKVKFSAILPDDGEVHGEVELYKEDGTSDEAFKSLAFGKARESAMKRGWQYATVNLIEIIPLTAEEEALDSPWKPKVFDKRVRWEFKVAFHGYGRTCKEALIDGAESLQHQCEYDFHQSDFNAIEEHETVDVIIDDTEEDDS